MPQALATWTAMIRQLKARATHARAVQARTPATRLLQRTVVASGLAVAACCSVLSSTREACAEDRGARSVTDKGDAVVVGSSSMNQSLGRIIAGELERRGYRVLRKGVSAAGLARPDYKDMNEILDELPISADTAAVFVYLGMNDAQPLKLNAREQEAFGREFLPWSDARWQTLYTQRAQEFFERICSRGAQRAIVLLPVDVQRDKLQRRLERIRALQSQAASASSCAVALPTGGDAGHFEVEGVAMRRRDGFHMSVSGAHAVWRRIQGDALRLVGAHESLYEPHGPGCVASCRIGQGLLFRPNKRAVQTEYLASDVIGLGPTPRCTSW